LRNIFVQEIIKLLESDDKVLGSTNHFFNNVQPSETINEESLDWINPKKKNKSEYISKSKAKIIICDSSVEISEDLTKDKCIIIVENPKLTFLRIVNKFFEEKIKFQIHPTAIIHPEAKISENCHIGPFNYIGRCEISEGTVIQSNCFINDNVTIGKNVIIDTGTVIGNDGFGFQRNKDGVLEKFPHIGGVIIKDNVEIGSNSSIDRGSLGYTIIEEGSKIDNLVHISHNVKVGKHCVIIANTVIGGSTVIGDYSWVSPSVTILDQLSTGNKVTIGVGAVVTKNIPDNETWTGSPAMPFKDFLILKRKLSKL
jgi:UDP-3-O-[3-hydroxymyristoyl] glucosamine N-acyltransferase